MAKAIIVAHSLRPQNVGQFQEGDKPAAPCILRWEFVTGLEAQYATGRGKPCLILRDEDGRSVVKLELDDINQFQQLFAKELEQAMGHLVW